MSVTSCSEEGVRTYRVAADETKVEAPVPEVAAASRPLRWQVPADWVRETPGQFQTALYRLGPAAVVSVSMLSGDAGGMAANVNRWRKQLGLEPAEEIGGEAIALEDGGSPARWFELRGEREGILAAIIPLEGETWFFKLNAPTLELETKRSGFMTFLKSIQIGSNAAQPDGGGATGSGGLRINLDVPAGWEKNEGGAMRVASFRIPGTDGGVDGDVSVIPVPGDAGTTLEHVNRWRAQLRLPALQSENDPALGRTLDGLSGPLVVTHMVSEQALFGGNRKGAISTAILRVGEVTWFFKMAGDADGVGRNRDTFETFVRSAVIP